MVFESKPKKRTREQLENNLREDSDLIHRWRSRRDESAISTLIQKYTPLVVREAQRRSTSQMEIQDLISLGQIGLWKAAEKFNSDMEHQFSTYAVWWVRAEIMTAVNKNRSVVSGPRTANRNAAVCAMLRCAYTNEPIDLAKVASDHDLRVDDVVALRNWLFAPCRSLDDKARNDGGERKDQSIEVWCEETDSVEERLGADQERARKMKLVARAMRGMEGRTVDVVRRRYLEEDQQSLKSIGDVHGISRERVRQIEARAIDKMRRVVSCGRG